MHNIYMQYSYTNSEEREEIQGLFRFPQQRPRITQGRSGSGSGSVLQAFKDSPPPVRNNDMKAYRFPLERTRMAHGGGVNDDLLHGFQDSPPPVLNNDMKAYKFPVERTRIPHGGGVNQDLLHGFQESPPSIQDDMMKSMRWPQERTRIAPKQTWNSSHDPYNLNDMREYKECQCSKSKNLPPELLRIYCDTHT